MLSIAKRTEIPAYFITGEDTRRHRLSYVESERGKMKLSPSKKAKLEKRLRKERIVWAATICQAAWRGILARRWVREYAYQKVFRCLFI